MKTLPLLAFTLAAPTVWAASPTLVVSATSPVSATVTSITISTTITPIATSTTALTSATNLNLPPLPLTVGNQPRTLENTLTLAARHPLLTSSAARVEEARGIVKSARGSRWFTLTGDAEIGAQHFNEPGTSGSEGVADAGLSLNQPLTDGGRRRGAVQSAEERFSGATENLAWQQRLRRYTAAQAHVNLWLAQELVENNADNVNQLEQIYSEVRGRLTHREATVTEVAESESRLASARATQAERIAALGNAQAAYLRDVGEPVTLVANPGTGVAATESGAAVHPLIAAAQHAVEEAGGLVKQRAAGYWPTLDLRSRVSHNANAGTSRTDAATQGQVTLNLGYTFIDNGVVSGETAAARANRKAAEADLANIKLEVEAARFNAQSNLTEAERRLTESMRARTESTRVIKNLMQEVKQGNRTLRDLLDARRDELAAANAWSQAYANRTLVTYDLERWQ